MRQSLHVPAEVLAKFNCSATKIGLVLLRHSRVLHRDCKSFRNRRCSGLRLSLEKRTRLIENPGLTERSTRDHHRRTPGLTLQTHRILGRLDVAVSNNGNIERLSDSSDLLPSR